MKPANRHEVARAWGTDLEHARLSQSGRVLTTLDRIAAIVTRRRFGTVAPGRLYRGGALPNARFGRVIDRYGIRSVIDLRKACAAVLAERAFLDGIGVTHVHLPTGQVPTPATVRDFLRWASQPEAAPVYLHCTHGRGRAVIFGILYLVEREGMSMAQAMRRHPWRTTLGNMAPNTRKGRFLRTYQPLRCCGGAADIAPPGGRALVAGENALS